MILTWPPEVVWKESIAQKHCQLAIQESDSPSHDVLFLQEMKIWSNRWWWEGKVMIPILIPQRIIQCLDWVSGTSKVEVLSSNAKTLSNYLNPHKDKHVANPPQFTRRTREQINITRPNSHGLVMQWWEERVGREEIPSCNAIVSTWFPQNFQPKLQNLIGIGASWLVLKMKVPL